MRNAAAPSPGYVTTAADVWPARVALGLGVLAFPFMVVPAAAMALAAAALVLGSLAFVRSRLDPRTYGGQGTPNASLAASVLALAAVLTMPSIREEDGSQGRVIGSLRAIVSAQAAFAETHRGYCAILECLEAPYRQGHTGLQPRIPEYLARYGYQLELHAGRPLAHTTSAASVDGFAVIAFPVDPSPERPRRAFCADATQIIYESPDGRPPRVEAGRCGDRTRALR
jgi:hypothetical protein